MDKVIGGIMEMDATVNDLLDFATDKQPQFGPVCVLSLVENTCEQLAPQLSAQAVRLTVDVPDNVHVRADAGMLRRAVLNLILNALDAMPDGGELVITGVDYDESVELEIADSGPGLAPSTIKRVFEPFFTTKSHGAGLGLAIVSHILERHQGVVYAMNCPEGGAAFTLQLPRVPAESQEVKVA